MEKANGIAKSFYMMHYCGSIAFLPRRLQVLLSDSKIRELISSGVLTETRSENLGPVSYDLTTRAFPLGKGGALKKLLYLQVILHMFLRSKLSSYPRI